MISKTVREFVDRIRKESGKACVMWSLTITSEGYEVTQSERDGVELERMGVAQRNLRGEWVLARDAMVEPE